MCQSFRSVAVVMALALLASSVQAQQKGPGGRGGFGIGAGGAPGMPLVTLAGTESVQKELGLSGDVAGKLTALRDEYRAAQQKELQAAGINFQNIQNQSAEERRANGEKMLAIGAKLNEEFNPKAKALLNADQVKRIEQILLQANLGNAGSAALLGELAARLNITDDQRQKLRTLGEEYGAKRRDLFTGGGFDREAAVKLRQEENEKMVALLTAEQKQKLDELKGNPFDVSQLGFGGFGGRRGKN